MTSNFDDIQIQFDLVPRKPDPKRSAVTENLRHDLPSISNSSDGEDFL